MAANLTPQYREAEERFKGATEPKEKVLALREMIALIPKHKGTERMQADLKRRLKQLEEEAAKPGKGGGGGPDPGYVRKEGGGQWVLIGPPNAGKSAIVAALTHAHPEVAPWPFTTRAPLPGMMECDGGQAQLVDTPAVTTTHGEAWMANLVRGADGILLVFDVAGDDTEDGWKGAQALLSKARVRSEDLPAVEGESPLTKAIPVLVAANKVDLDGDGLFREMLKETLGAGLPILEVSATEGTGVEALRQELWTRLRCLRIYAKQPGHKPDLERPFLLPEGSTVEDLALSIHKEIAQGFQHARIWGSGAFPGQQVDRHHVLADRDVVEIHA